MVSAEHVSDKPYFKVTLFCIAAVAFVFPYPAMAWWKFGIATFFVFLSFKTIFPNTYRKILGLEMSRGEWIQTSLALVLVAVISELLIRIVLQGGEMRRVPGPLVSTWPLQPIFQAANEEMVARAAAFHFLMRFVKSRLWISIFIAVLFVALHAVFFAAAQSVTLTWITLFSLFFATLTMNNLFLRYRHVGYAFAVHAGWNYQKFGATYTDPRSGQPLLDGEKFNLVEGSSLVLMITMILFLGSLFLLRKKPTVRESTQP